MLVVLNSILSFAKRNGLCINIKHSFHVSCITCSGLFAWLYVWKVLILIFHFIKPMMHAEDVCIRAGQVMPAINKGTNGAQWMWNEVLLENQIWSLLSFNWKKLGDFLHPEIKRATWPESPGGLWARTRWWPFDLLLPFEHWLLFCLFCFFLAAKWC